MKFYEHNKNIIILICVFLTALFFATWVFWVSVTPRIGMSELQHLQYDTIVSGNIHDVMASDTLTNQQTISQFFYHD